MADETARLGMRRPGENDNVAYDLDLNNIRNTLDAAVDRVFTSTTRPAAPYVGMMGFETDKERRVIWNGTSWIYLDIVPVADAAERDALNAFEGMRIYRIDKAWEETYVAGAWRMLGIQLVDALANVPNPYNHQIANLAGVLHVWDGTQWNPLISPPASVDHQIFGATGNLTENGWVDWAAPTISFANPGYPVNVSAVLSGGQLNGGSTDPAGGLRVGISFDGGSTFTFGNEPDSRVGELARAASRQAIAAVHHRSGTPTGNIMVKAQISVVGSGSINFVSGLIVGRVDPQ